MFLQLFFIYTFLLLIIVFLGIISYNTYKLNILYKQYLINEAKENIVKTICMGIEQLYKNLSNEEKLNKAITNINIILKENNIKITDLELRMLIESSILSIKLKGEV